MTGNDDIRRELDMIDIRLCALLAKREELAGGSRVPDRRRLAAVRKIEQRFGRSVAETYKAFITGGAADEGARRAEGGFGEPELIDITREFLGAPVYPGDPEPHMERVLSIADGAVCNVSAITAGTHTGTHMDAPLHFIDGGRDIAGIPPEKYIGKCFVADWDTFASRSVPEGCKRVLIKNSRELTEDLAYYAIGIGLMLIGVEGTSVGGEDVHVPLLGKEIVLLESLDLSAAQEGEYLLFCAPLKIEGADGAPCRAFLLAR